MSDERVFQLLMETNPVPDPDALDSPVALAQLERGSATMATTDRISTEAGSPTPRRAGMIFAVAAALVLIAGLATWALVGRTDNTAGPDIDVVLAAYEAQNNGDVDAYLAMLSPAVASDLRQDNLLPLLAIINDRMVFVEPCRRVEPRKADTTRVECTVTYTNDLEEPAGVVLTSTEFFTVDADNIITSLDSVDTGFAHIAAFYRDFWTWLRVEHPEVYAQIEPLSDDSLPGYRLGFTQDPSDALIALQYIAEFVAQSEKYPIGDS